MTDIETLRGLAEHYNLPLGAKLVIAGACDEIERLRAQLSAPADGKREQVLTAQAVGNAMTDAWNSICSDTGCHPLDITHRGTKLFFAPQHWANLTASLLFARVITAGLAASADGKQVGEAAYRDAIDEALVVRHLGIAKDDPRKELNDILSWEVAVALDPRVSSAAQALIDSGGAQAGKMREALEKIAYAPPGGVGPTLRESIEIARAALSAASPAPQAARREALLLDVFKAASVYYGCYVQDEAEELECCISHEQHEAAKALRDALRAALSAQSAVPSEDGK